MLKFIRTLFYIFIGFLVYQIVIRIIRKNFHFPAPAFFGSVLDSNCRRTLQSAKELVERSGIQSGMEVAEVGCGSGAYTLHVAEKIGPEGKVYAIDIQQKMLDQLQNKMDKHKVKNIEPIKANAYELPFTDSSLDLVYLVTVLQEIPNRSQALAEIRRVLRPGGIIAVSEFLPDPDYPLLSTTKKQLKKAGFAIDAAEGNFWTYTVRGVKE